MGRAAQLRAKFASQLADLSRVDFREPASDKEIDSLRAVFGTGGLPGHVADLYRLADGECSQGVFVPQLEFLRVEFVVALKAANETAISMKVLPKELVGSVPIFRDSIGNQLVLIEGGVSSLQGGVYYLDMESLEARIVSETLPALIERLVQMHEQNAGASKLQCPGDFRRLSQAEEVIASRVEAGRYPFSLQRGHNWLKF